VASMPAYRLLAPGESPAWCEVDVPMPQPGEVLVRMGGAGLCRTDLELLDGGSVLPFSKPFTLGHENAGWVEQLGPDVTDLALGEAVVVSAIRSCGECRACVCGRGGGVLRFSRERIRPGVAIKRYRTEQRRHDCRQRS
jgi:alcohol dehydrogenase, propanol-preferring